MVNIDFQCYFPTKSYSSISQNIKMWNGLIAQKAKVLNFALILDFNCDCMSKKKKKKIKNIVPIQSYVYDFVEKFEKVCLGLIVAFQRGGLLKCDLGRDMLLRLKKETHFYTKFCQKMRHIFIPEPQI